MVVDQKHARIALSRYLWGFTFPIIIPLISFFIAYIVDGILPLVFVRIIAGFGLAFFIAHLFDTGRRLFLKTRKAASWVYRALVVPGEAVSSSNVSAEHSLRLVLSEIWTGKWREPPSESLSQRRRYTAVSWRFGAISYVTIVAIVAVVLVLLPESSSQQSKSLISYFLTLVASLIAGPAGDSLISVAKSIGPNTVEWLAYIAGFTIAVLALVPFARAYEMELRASHIQRYDNNEAEARTWDYAVAFIWFEFLTGFLFDIWIIDGIYHFAV